MIRYHCDICGDKITETNSPHFSVGCTVDEIQITDSLNIEFVLHFKPNNKRTDVCVHCVLDKINEQLDNRTKEEPVGRHPMESK